jgi:hypothetical protein
MLLTGIPSPGKARLRAALDAAGVPLTGVAAEALALRIHAETDLEALLEPGLQRETRAAAAKADLVVPVDWESPEDSVKRVIAVLAKGEGRGA